MFYNDKIVVHRYSMSKFIDIDVKLNPLPTQTHHRTQSFDCNVCGEHFANLVDLQQHKRSAHPTQQYASRKRPLQHGEGNIATLPSFSLVENSINGAAQTYRLPFNATLNEEYVADLNSAVMWSAREQIQQLAREKNVKWYLTLSLVFHQATRPDVLTDPPIYFRTEPMSSSSCKYIQH